MPVNLNLIPTELTVSKDLNNFLKTVKALGVISSVAFLFFGIGIMAFFLYSKVNLNKLNTKVATLKSQVSAQEKSEQQIVLLKDRLGKISAIQKIPSSITKLNTIEPVLSKLSENTAINQMKVVPAEVDLSLIVKTNSDLKILLDSIKDTNLFKSVDLTTFNFSPSVGYSVELQIVLK